MDLTTKNATDNLFTRQDEIAAAVKGTNAEVTDYTWKRHILTVFQNSGIMDKCIAKWRTKPANRQDIDLFKLHFKNGHDEVYEIQALQGTSVANQALMAKQAVMESELAEQKAMNQQLLSQLNDVTNEVNQINTTDRTPTSGSMNQSDLIAAVVAAIDQGNQANQENTPLGGGRRGTLPKYKGKYYKPPAPNDPHTVDGDFKLYKKKIYNTYETKEEERQWCPKYPSRRNQGKWVIMEKDPKQTYEQ